MRPVRLELEGFTAYREATEIDFEGADLFVLSGATGSGKSTVIDAMSFALYGSVPRYNDPSLIAPVISQGKLEARVRFDFTVADTPYSAVRVVRRNNDRVSTREARLESEGHTLAGNVRELNEKITELFGLSFEQFTTCVVLPQGEFARFLHERPGERQKLLRELLGLKLYERMRKLAGERDGAARTRVTRLEGQLEGVAHATPEARRKLAGHIRDLRKLQKTVDLEQKEIDRLDAEHRRLTELATAREKDAARLEKFRIPRGAEKLGETEAQAASALGEAIREREAAGEALTAAESTRGGLPDPGPLKLMIETHREHGERSKHLAEAEAKEVASCGEHQRAALEVDQRRTAVDQAREAVATVDRAHAAHRLASALHAGDPCPVCLREIEDLPKHAKPPGLAAAKQSLGAAERALKFAERTAAETLQARTRDAADVAALRREVERLEGKLRDAPDTAQLVADLQASEQADAVLAAAREALAAAQTTENAARARAEELAERSRTAWARLDLKRDELSALQPPSVERDDLAGAWKLLSEWATTEGEQARGVADEARTAADDIARSADDKREAIVRILAEFELGPGGDRPRDTVMKSIAAHEGGLKEIDEQLDAARRLVEQLETARTEQTVARSLARHLSADGFERWLLQEAFHRLVGAAGERLRELSRGDYSFRADARLNFEIVDHRNADEVRSARTLSGGETFLASLALALALADQVAELAAEGAAPLDSMFLDEGFGTLDPETLDVVATTIEELGARGRTIGLVTHVRELADRIPVQYRVTRGPASSVIEKVVS